LYHSTLGLIVIKKKKKQKKRPLEGRRRACTVLVHQDRAGGQVDRAIVTKGPSAQKEEDALEGSYLLVVRLDIGVQPPG